LASMGCAGLLIAVLALWNAFFVYVKPGTHLVVIAKRGAALSPNQVLADEGQAGIQRRVLGEGWHLVWPIVYETERHPNVIVPAGQVGIVTAKGGDPLPAGQALAEKATQQGIQRQVLPPGEYRINTYGYSVELVPAVEIPAGYVGVQRRLLGNDKGILSEVLQPGLYFINTKEFEIIKAEVGMEQTTFRYDKDPNHNTAIKFTSKGGFEISMDCTVEWEVLPQDVPNIVKEYGDWKKVEENVIKLQAHAIGRDKGIDYGVQDLLEGDRRKKFQEDYTNELKRKCSAKNVGVRSAFIRDIVIPEAYLKPIRDKQVASETELTNQAKQATADSLALVEREKRLVDQRVATVQAETVRMVAAIDREVQNIGTKTHAEVEKMKAEYDAKIATLDADRTRVLGEAQAQVSTLKETAKNGLYQLKMDVFGNDGNAYLRYTLAESLNPKMSLRLMHSGPGTFWTNMDGKGFNLMMPAPSPKEKEKK
jgi:hypothetical protein